MDNRIFKNYFWFSVQYIKIYDFLLKLKTNLLNYVIRYIIKVKQGISEIDEKSLITKKKTLFVAEILCQQHYSIFLIVHRTMLSLVGMDFLIKVLLHISTWGMSELVGLIAILLIHSLLREKKYFCNAKHFHKAETKGNYVISYKKYIKILLRSFHCVIT